ncbi:hypothetical protein NQ317_006315 [Molorchus minor]|uniref:Uncharacterized protein n=1 Tax=Molorchus minor TaxID=1323400 RepID=A0ABQ9JNM0_9CUCU|nr:hypothetical protein NQ317_006315 [Molorchus minor]
MSRAFSRESYAPLPNVPLPKALAGEHHTAIAHMVEKKIPISAITVTELEDRIRLQKTLSFFLPERSEWKEDKINYGSESLAEIFATVMTACKEKGRHSSEQKSFICFNSKVELQAILAPRTKYALDQECRNALEQLAR